MGRKKTCGVYKITSPSGKVYIGSSVDIENRLCSYRNYACKSQTRLYNSLVKYGWDRHSFEIVELCEVTNLFKLETHYGEIYKVLDRKTGLNCRLPKEGETGSFMAEETKKKIGEANKGRGLGKTMDYYSSSLKKLTPEDVDLIRIKLSENKLTQKEIGELFNVSRKIIGNINTGKTYKTVYQKQELPTRKKKYIKLETSDYETIRNMSQEGVSQVKIASLFCVNPSHISRIINNQGYIKTLNK